MRCLRGTNLSKAPCKHVGPEGGRKRVCVPKHASTQPSSENNSAPPKNRSHHIVVSEKTWRQGSHGSGHRAEPEVTKKPYPPGAKMCGKRDFTYSSRELTSSLKWNPMHHTRCGELHTRPSDAAVEFDVRPKVPREAARLAHSLPTFAAWLHTGWLLLVLGLQQ